MLQPIPGRILKHNITLRVCTGVDTYQHPTWQDTDVSRVAVQPTSETRLSKDNTDVELTSVVFVDARLSIPVGLDIDCMKRNSESHGHSMQLIFNGVTYTVKTVDALYDDESRYHHTEIGVL